MYRFKIELSLNLIIELDAWVEAIYLEYSDFSLFINKNFIQGNKSSYIISVDFLFIKHS